MSRIRVMQEEINPYTLSLELGVSWRHAKLKDGYYFCTCDNPLHDDCSIAINKGDYCIHCELGCQKRK